MRGRCLAIKVVKTLTNLGQKLAHQGQATRYVINILKA
jgi:hypothetical protein